MRISQQFFTTLREEPADAKDVRSHALMVKAGFIEQLAAGIYTYGPLMKRVLTRIETIIREEHDRVGCQELLMPALQPRDIWEESGRWDRYVADGILYHFEDGRGRELCLGPTHEEVITQFVKSRLTSHKQLPFTLYQIQTKFRDEIRPRFGLMRGREFIMKDAYSFDADEASMAESYAKLSEVYHNIFRRCGLRFTAVKADAGAIGGSGSEEFMVDAETGEDAIAVCRETGYAANVETACSQISAPPKPDQVVDAHKEPTPGATTCEDLIKLFPELPIERLLKTVIYEVTTAEGSQAVAVMCRGDREINVVKLANVLGALKLELANPKLVKQVTGAEVGFAGPVGLAEGTRLLADRSVEGVEGFLCGANETDMHMLDMYFGRDLEQPETHDFGEVQAGDTTECGGGTIEITRGIEVGHIFQLGTKYSEAMELKYADPNQKLQHVWMGCYGIGVSRVAAAAIEQSHDEAGMIWPLPIAPHQVLLVQVKVGDEAQDKLALELYEKLQAAGVDVLWDDRSGKKLRFGAKMKDADLVGIPLRVVVGGDAAEGLVEWKPRVPSEGDEDKVTLDRALELVAQAIAR